MCLDLKKEKSIPPQENGQEIIIALYLKWYKWKPSHVDHFLSHLQGVPCALVYTGMQSSEQTPRDNSRRRRRRTRVGNYHFHFRSGKTCVAGGYPGLPSKWGRFATQTHAVSFHNYTDSPQHGDVDHTSGSWLSSSSGQEARIQRHFP